MLKKTVKYVDFNGEEQSEDLYFNLNEPEAVRLMSMFGGDLEKYIEGFDAQNRPDEIVDMFETLLKMSYGVKSRDGRSFMKDKETLDQFVYSAAYAALFVELLGDAEKAAAFFSDIVAASAVQKHVESGVVKTDS